MYHVYYMYENSDCQSKKLSCKMLYIATNDVYNKSICMFI